MKVFIRNFLEKLLGRFYEGPKMPLRLSDLVVAFANMYPRATRAEWVRFAQSHASVCYQAGYVRGIESSERDYQEPETPPEVLADAIDPMWRHRVYDWKWGHVRELSEPGGVPQESIDDDPVRVILEHQFAMNEVRKRNKFSAK
jgi:hypothetical protein